MLVLFVLNLGIGFLKYGKLVAYHMYTGKASAVFLYAFFVHALLFSPSVIFFYITAASIALGLLEEILVTLVHKKFVQNKVSFFK